jgi:UDP-N-acetylmuramate: L-alanyl-gamma-D-glutamyl-meso-diaminopimelate ligase
MVGAQLEGYDCMVRLSDSAKFMLLEGDEYLSSPIDRRPKFHLYKPHVALLSGVAWDHINVFPTWDNYVDQFRQFCQLIEPRGTLVYNESDETLMLLADEMKGKLTLKPYQTPSYEVRNEGPVLTWNNKQYALSIFGEHNLQNIVGAMKVAESLGISNDTFLTSIQTFKGAGKRLQKIVEEGDFTMFMDFAHSPSKLMATTKAVKEQFATRKVVACMELHTFSSLKKEFLPHYLNTMNAADEALVYFNPDVVKHKKLDPISIDDVAKGFGGQVKVVNQTADVLQFIREKKWDNSVLLMMSSGTFDGINYSELGEELVSKLG